MARTPRRSVLGYKLTWLYLCFGAATLIFLAMMFGLHTSIGALESRRVENDTLNSISSKSLQLKKPFNYSVVSRLSARFVLLGEDDIELFQITTEQTQVLKTEEFKAFLKYGGFTD
ncbi:hypothetical protein NDN08_004047 [Rhodosorus marinus]|uniref:Uncharacterized protein n=1 Tax=Rhodosorus marinus TaxID=101924 RepID=A0AAV8UKQ4_9RHOD|nr:hypothetical protein NDN08_004047 [Rhodosorus marinus]